MSGACSLSVKAEKEIKAVNLVVRGGDRAFEFSYFASGKNFLGEFKIENPVFWSVTNPFLYEYDLKLGFDGETESISGTFGIINLLSRGEKKLLLNGTPVFLRGYIRGTTAHEHSNNCNLSEEDFYRKNLHKNLLLGQIML